MRRIISLIALSALALTACGGSDETAETTPAPNETEATAETTATPDTAAPAETAAPADVAAAPAETGPADTAAPSGAVAVTMVEWAVEAPIEIAAGTVTFDVTNGGSFPHHFAIARGDSYEDLPMSVGGAIDEVGLGDDYLGKTANLQSDQTETIEFDLEPGIYVFFCNIAGSVSHAAQGQVLSVTAS